MDLATYEPELDLQAPNNRNAEEALLGSILIDPAKLAVIDLYPEEFYIVRHRWVWEAYLSLKADNQPVDLLTVSERLQRQSRLEEAGGAAFLMGLLNQTPTSLHAEAYAGIVRENYQRRELLRQANELAKAAYDRETGVDMIVADATTKLVNVSKPNGGGSRHFSHYLSRHYDRVDQLSRDPAAALGMFTGMGQYDVLTGGVYPGEFILIYGQPKVRKSQWIAQMAAGLAQNGHGGSVYEIEMPEELMMDREVSRLSKMAHPGSSITTDKLERGELSDDDWPVYTHIVEMYGDKHIPLYYNFDPQTTASIEADANRMKAEAGIRWIMIDYMRLLGDRYGQKDPEAQRQEQIALTLKAVSRRTGLAIICIHNLLKPGLSSVKPSIGDTSGGAGITYDADKVIFVTNHIPPSGYEPDPDKRTFIVELSRRKLRQSRKSFDMTVLRDYPMFSDPPPMPPEEERSFSKRFEKNTEGFWND